MFRVAIKVDAPNERSRRAVEALGHVGITDVITLMGFYTSVSMTLAFYDVPAGAAGAPDAVHVIFRMLRHIVIDNVTDAGDVESARGDIGRDHDFVFAALESFERLDSLALSAI